MRTEKNVEKKKRIKRIIFLSVIALFLLSPVLLILSPVLLSILGLAITISLPILVVIIGGKLFKNKINPVLLLILGLVIIFPFQTIPILIGIMGWKFIKARARKIE
ncbi:hypothetical protein NST17_20800 [Caldifermentibacillus hisashii]|uniref:Uncharacterized protein n=1 Tax=Caldifermentibacillus hisashii TaxID=996558 RepID=A0ABU9K6E4_9BACI|nr:hypothetical protein [Caldifermentibacillus hisashii]MED4852236.1 hypothetical protein [Caldifermentibacillus hisashii]NWN98813.1 hypothetical protein [Bacillus sp. (in: firmicutes)]